MPHKSKRSTENYIGYMGDGESTYSYGSATNYNYIADCAVISAATLVGLLYGAVAAAMLVSLAAIFLTSIAIGIAREVALRGGSELSMGSPKGVLWYGIGGPLVFAGVATAVLAFTALVTPLLIVHGTISSAQHAKNNPMAGLLDRVFNKFLKISNDLTVIKQQLVNKLESQIKGKKLGNGNIEVD